MINWFVQGVALIGSHQAYFLKDSYVVRSESLGHNVTLRYNAPLRYSQTVSQKCTSRHNVTVGHDATEPLCPFPISKQKAMTAARANICRHGRASTLPSVPETHLFRKLFSKVEC